MQDHYKYTNKPPNTFFSIFGQYNFDPEEIAVMAKPTIKLQRVAPINTTCRPYMRKGVLYLPCGSKWASGEQHGFRYSSLAKVFCHSPYVILVKTDSFVEKISKVQYEPKKLIWERLDQIYFFFGRTHKSGWGQIYTSVNDYSLPLHPLMESAANQWKIFKHFKSRL